MNNKLSKLRIAILASSAVVALSAAGSVNAETDLLKYSIISGGEVNVAAQPEISGKNVGGHLAAQAAVIIGANTTANNIYAGAAVTTGDGSQVKHIHAGAAAGVGANAVAYDVTADAAVVVGANGAVRDISAGAAITLGAGATYRNITKSTAITFGAGSAVETESAQIEDFTVGGVANAADMTAKMNKIKDELGTEHVLANVEPNKDLSGLILDGRSMGTNTFYFSAVNITADATLHIVSNVTIITSEAVTLGAGASINMYNGSKVKWILGGALNLGAGTKWQGETYVKGAVNASTSDVCGNIFATGPVSVRSIGDESKCVATANQPTYDQQ
jgi:hypothetical protein